MFKEIENVFSCGQMFLKIIIFSDLEVPGVQEVAFNWFNSIFILINKTEIDKILV